MNLLRFIIHRKTFVSMLFIGLTLLGYISYRNLPVELFPNAEFPLLIVMVSGQTEVDPSYMERQAVIPLEGAIGTLEGIEEISSFADQRSGTIIVYYTHRTNITHAYLKLQEKVDAVKNSLPDGFQVVVQKIDTEQLANTFMNLQVRGSGGADRIRNIVDQRILRELENIDGIANVEVFGGRQKSVEIILDEDACDAIHVTPFQIRSLIRNSNQMKTFVGRVFLVEKRIFVNVTAEFTHIQDLADIVVRETGPILLRDVADIFMGVQEETSISRVNGMEAVTIQLVRDAQVNLIDLSHVTKAAIENLNERLKPLDVEILIQNNMAEDMEKNINLIIELAILGGCLAVIVLWMFLRNFRLVVTIALAIPISIFTAFNFFYAFDISINSLTLVGMALAVGMLLDNSVVVLENVYRHASRKKDADLAVVVGTKEVWRSIFAATLTTITVFVPFLFSSNFMISLIGRHIGVSIISTLTVSLVVALMLIPMITHFFLRRKLKTDVPTFQRVSQKHPLIQKYTVILKSCVRYPARTIIGAVTLFFISIFICLALSLNVSREVDSESIDLYVTMPSGSTLETADQVVADLEQRLENLEEKEDVTSRIYADDATITVRMKEEYEDIAGRNLPQIKSDIQERIDDFRAAEVSFEQPTSSTRYRGGGSGGGSNPGASFERMLGIGAQTERIVIKGSDFTRMRGVAEDVRYYLEDLTTMQSVRLNIADNRPEIHLQFDTQLLELYRVPLNNIASELSTFRNSFSSGMTFKQGIEEYDITIRTSLEDEEEEDVRTIDDLRALSIPASESATYELQQLSDIIFTEGMSRINRVNQEKQIEVTYRFLSEVNASKTFLTAARAEVDEIIAALPIPAGIAVEVLHVESDLSEFYFLIGAAFILIYMILASVFESFSTPVVMMFSIPLAAIGSFWALILTGNSLFNANTLTGFLILLGVVVNNGIILIDYSRILRRNGYRRERALIMAGQARIRPILITVITTIVAMFPLAMGRAEYVTSIGAPFAITVIGGLALSTLFTLVFIPTLYSGLESALSWMRRLDWRIKAAQFVLWALLAWLIYRYVDSFVIKLLDFFLILILIPGLTYFIMTSLRQAKTKLIGAKDKITIQVQNIVKIYDRESRFVREWKKGKTIRDHAGMEKAYASWRDFEVFVYQVPLTAFLVYFVYFYLKSGFWLFLLSHAVYFCGFALWNPIASYLQTVSKRRKKPYIKKLADRLGRAYFWGFPLFNLVLFQLRWKSTALIIIIFMIWYTALLIYTTSNRLHRENVNIARLKGRFAGPRRKFYEIVKVIPIIGKKKRPFRALDRVSLEIGSGMFGLLGPNGAGKTTLMRLICGILDPNYGKIWINGIDTGEKREELQGLIGYLPQEFGMYENMTASEFLNYQAMLKGLLDREQREQMVDDVLRSVHMVEHKHQKIGSYSGGMKQRIGIAQILLHLPRILVVDEPTAGLDPRERIRFRNLLVELSRDRVVIFSTHIIEDISSSCSKVAVLNKGRLKYLGEPVNMTKIAQGRVWQFHVPVRDFEAMRKEHMVVHHIRDGDRIRVRCISDTRPVPDALEARPSLEDAYLCLLREDGNGRTGDRDKGSGNREAGDQPKTTRKERRKDRKAGRTEQRAEKKHRKKEKKEARRRRKRGEENA